MIQERITYPCDLSDEKWNRISPIISGEKSRGRNRSTDLRDIVDGINYRWSTGCVWRMLPHDYPPWETVYYYFNRWKNNGMLSRIRHEVITRNSSRKYECLVKAKNWVA